MPKNTQGKNKKWSKHVEKTHGQERFDEIEEKAARLGVEVWELNQESSSGEEKEEIKEQPGEDSDSEEVIKGHQGLMEISNPNRLRPLRKSDFRTEEEMADSKKALKQKAMTTSSDLQRLQEVRARREAAAKQREEQKLQRENLKEEAKKSGKRRS